LNLNATRILITVQMMDDTDELAYLFAIVTGLFERVAWGIASVAAWYRDTKEAATVAGKIISIGVASLRFGMGL